jgi:hypothetical protein
MRPNESEPIRHPAIPFAFTSLIKYGKKSDQHHIFLEPVITTFLGNQPTVVEIHELLQRMVPVSDVLN